MALRTPISSAMILALLFSMAATAVASHVDGALPVDGTEQASPASAQAGTSIAKGEAAGASSGSSAGRLGAPKQTRTEGATRVLFAADGGAAPSPDAPAGAPSRGNVTASGGLAFLSETISLQQQQVTFAQASTGCQSCCSTGQCMQAYMDQSMGICCSASPAAMCCPQGSTCSNGQCAAGQFNPQAGYGAAQGGDDQGGYGYGPRNPIQALLHWVSQNMMLVWIILAILGCMGVGGPAVHYAQMALCGMSLFNCLCPGAANNMYGDGGGYGGGFNYGPPGGF